MKMVMEKSWNMKNWPKVMEFCSQSWNFTNFAPELDQICIFVATTKKLSIDVESPLFLTFSAKRRKCKINERVCGNPGTFIAEFPLHRENSENGHKSTLSGKAQGNLKICGNTGNLYAPDVNSDKGFC